MLAMDYQPQRIVAFVPNWVGDAVMFTPTLRAIRQRFAEARLALLARRGPAATLTPNPWTDEIIVDEGDGRAAVAELRGGDFDLAVLGPNSFRSALMARRGGIARRVGYRRSWRGALLTDALSPPRRLWRFAVTPALDYYLKLAEYLGCEEADRRMELAVAEEDVAAAEALLTAAGVEQGRALVVMNPGAGFGPSKLYPADRFAAVADSLVESRGAQIVINAAPTADERRAAEGVEGAMRQPVLLNLAGRENTLGLVKAILARADLTITNDTGARHIAAALDVPVVTVFASTDPGWTEIHYDKERIVRVDVPCGPCQRKRCWKWGRKHHRCMLEIPPETVVAAAEELLAAKEGA